MKQWENHHGDFIERREDLDIIDCIRCGFKHVIPLPARDFIHKYYDEEFVATRPKMHSKIKEDLEWWEIVSNEKYDLFEKFVKKDIKKILDVGCGFGYFLQVGGKRKWDIVGLDLSKQSIDHVKDLGIKAILGDIQDDPLDEECFDVVHMQDVLEHIVNPSEILKIIRNHLNDSGLLCIVSPNDYNPLQLILKELGYPSWWVVPKLHLNYFDIKSISALLQKNGFEIIHVTTTFPLEMFLLMGDNYLGNSELGRNIHAKRKNLEIAFKKSNKNHLKQQIYQSLSKLNIGREFMVVARKK